jgi:hypothetical protein
LKQEEKILQVDSIHLFSSHGSTRSPEGGTSYLNVFRVHTQGERQRSEPKARYNSSESH